PAVCESARTAAIVDLTKLVGQCLLAVLPDAAQSCIARLQAAAVNAADMTALAEAVPPLVSILRYGTARKIPEEAITALTHALAVEVIAGAAAASRHLDDEAAEHTRSALEAFDGALDLLAEQALLESWCRTLNALAAEPAAAPAVGGLAAPRLYERAPPPPPATAPPPPPAPSPAHPPHA